MPTFRTTTLALAVLASLAVAGGVIAQSTPSPAQQKELDAARTELDRAARRYAELAGKFPASEGMPMRFGHKLLRKPVLGVLLAPDHAGGVRIAGVTPNSGAEAAGIRSGDRLLSVDGKPVSGTDADARLDNARDLLSGLDAGAPVRLRYARDGRDAVVAVTPALDEHLFVLNGADGRLARLGRNAQIRQGSFGELEMTADSIEVDTEEVRDAMQHAMGALSSEMPRIQTEILRLGDCKRGENCRFPMLAEAFRWSGLNLAALDAQLGRYFGASTGVLVLSTGDELQGLQPGDVVQKIDGKTVGSPREAMAALRAMPADSNVRVDYLRDHKSASAQVKVPKADPLRIPAPPAPPAPPPSPAAPPAPPQPDVPAVPAPPAPPAAPLPPDAPRAITRRKIVTVDADGNRREWEDDGGSPLPPGDKRIEQRRMVFVDENGKTTVLEGDDAPAPPTPPAPPSNPAAPLAPPAGD